MAKMTSVMLKTLKLFGIKIMEFKSELVENTIEGDYDNEAIKDEMRLVEHRIKNI